MCIRDRLKIARLATQSGLFPVFEAEKGEVTSSTPIRKKVDVEEYLKLQVRYAHLFSPARNEAVINHLQEMADKNIRRYNLMPQDGQA